MEPDMKNGKDIAIVTENLSIGYRTGHHTKTLFSGLNLNLPSGALTCFMGPNGVGKSTLIRTLLGLHAPLGGVIRYRGGSAEPTEKRARQVAAVLTDRVSAINMTAEELVSFGRYPFVDWRANLSSDDRKFVGEAMQMVGIRDLAKEKVHTLSDGQLQMVMVARALAQDTPIILLDEPTAHLDLNNRLEIMTLLRRLAHDLNKAIMVASHELDLALQTADNIWLATSGGSIITGIPEDLVLSGSFDDVFRLKGFDLKTGKVHHPAHRKTTVRLIGNGHALRWTRNALERSGYSVADEGCQHTIAIGLTDDQLLWTIGDLTYATLGEVINHLSGYSRK